MSTKMKRLTLHLRTFLLLIWNAAEGDGYSCPYGQRCAFEPAPPGSAPSCAQPGLTYCVHPQPYPEHIIRHLIEAGQYDIRTLLSDETRDDFSVKKEYPYGYGPNSLPHVDQISLVNDVFTKNYNNKFHSRFNHDVWSQKSPLQPPSPVDPTPYNINAYQVSNFSKGFQGYTPNYWGPNNYYDKKVFRQNNLNPNLNFNPNINQNFNPNLNANLNANFNPNLNPNVGYNPNLFDNQNLYSNYETDWFRPPSSQVTEYNPNEWWKYISPSRPDVTVERSVTYPTRTTTSRRAVRRKRNAELVKAAAQRPLSGAEALRIALGLANDETTAERPRRQTRNAVELCRARTDFITPRAALNNRGDWRYVVNMPDNMTQLVRVEVCTSTECNGICSLPTGYTSRCEQKYIQKRLVALQASGDNLYTDVFWIPSCCQCTIVNNNN